MRNYPEVSETCGYLKSAKPCHSFPTCTERHPLDDFHSVNHLSGNNPQFGVETDILQMGSTQIVDILSGNCSLRCGSSLWLLGSPSARGLCHFHHHLLALQGAQWMSSGGHRPLLRGPVIPRVGSWCSCWYCSHPLKSPGTVGLHFGKLVVG